MTDLELQALIALSQAETMAANARTIFLQTTSQTVEPYGHGYGYDQATTKLFYEMEQRKLI